MATVSIAHPSCAPTSTPVLRLADLVHAGEAALSARYADRLTAEHRQALHAIARCRRPGTNDWVFDCPDCGEQQATPRSCGHRSCPRCQHHLASAWLARAQAKRLPVPYFLVTFTLPAALRPTAAYAPRTVYHALFRAAADTLQRFARNHPQLHGDTGFCAVLHTHSRRLDYHPHLHVVLPAGALDAVHHRWRSLSGHYLFNGRALACVFRATLLAHLRRAGLALPSLPRRWIVHVAHVGNGLPALTYLARYLYRGVIAETDLLAHDADTGTVTFRYRDGKTKRTVRRTLPLTDFLWQLLQHVLPTGFRRVRDFGFLHPNAKQSLGRVQLVLRVVLTPPPPPRAPVPLLCPCCGAPMRLRARVRSPSRVT